MDKFEQACQTIKDLCLQARGDCFKCRYKDPCDLVFGLHRDGCYPFEFPEFREGQLYGADQ